MPSQREESRSLGLGANRLTSLLQLPLTQLIKSDAAYEKAYWHRTERLKKLAAKSTRPDAFKQSAEATALNHELANNLRANITRAEAMFVLSPEAKLRLVFAWKDRNLAREGTETVEAAVKERLRAITVKAREFLLAEVRNPAEDIGEVLETQFKNESETTRLGINVEVQTTFAALTSFERRLDILRSYAALAMIYRGLLYSGIMEKEGGRLRRKALNAQADDTSREILLAALGSIPGVDKFVSLVDLLRIWAKDAEAELVETRDLVDDYVQAYGELLALWKAAATALASTMRETIEATGFDAEADQ